MAYKRQRVLISVMILFIWSHSLPLFPGRGGSESYTIGQVRELQKRGIETQIVTVGLGKEDGRKFYPDITFRDIASVDELTDTDDTVIFINLPYSIKTKKRSYVILHCLPPPEPDLRPDYDDRPVNLRHSLKNHTLIVNSKFARKTWARYLGVGYRRIHVVYPFADPSFAQEQRPSLRGRVTRVLFAGRLNPEKGIFTLLEAMQHKILQSGYRFTVTTAGNQTQEGKALENLLRHHPNIDLVPARLTPKAMAALLVRHKIVVMPSNHLYWHEAFGMLSVEAQHAGCWVVASKDGGLPETDCGGLLLFEPGNSFELAKAIRKGSQLEPFLIKQRKEAAQYFSRAESVDSLIKLLRNVRLSANP